MKMKNFFWAITVRVNYDLWPAPDDNIIKSNYNKHLSALYEAGHIYFYMLRNQIFFTKKRFDFSLGLLLGKAWDKVNIVFAGGCITGEVLERGLKL